MTKRSGLKHNTYRKYLEDKHAMLNTPEAIIKQVVKKATGSDIESSNRIIEGEVNEVYEVKTTAKQNIIVRISRSKHPRFEAEASVLSMVRSVGVPAPKVLLVERFFTESENLTFCIEEKIDGVALKNLINDLDQQSIKSIVSEAGNILSKIHSVRLDKFGGLDSEKPFKNWEGFVLGTEEKINKVFSASKMVGIDAAIITKAIGILKAHTNVYKNVESQLLHGDFSLKHLLVKEKHVVGIIDFENAKGGDPVFDFAWLNYFYGRIIPVDWLKSGYENVGLFDKYFELKMKLYRIYLGLEFIEYYVSEKNEWGMNESKKKIYQEISNF